VAAIAALYAPHAVLHHPMFPEPRLGRAAIVAEHEFFLSAFSDIDPAIRTILRADRTVAVELTIGATHTGPIDLGGEAPLEPTGRRVAVATIWVLELDEAGLIVEERDYIDPASIVEQLHAR
jgi:predicted ester cyclase